MIEPILNNLGVIVPLLFLIPGALFAIPALTRWRALVRPYREADASTRLLIDACFRSEEIHQWHNPFTRTTIYREKFPHSGAWLYLPSEPSLQKIVVPIDTMKKRIAEPTGGEMKSILICLLLGSALSAVCIVLVLATYGHFGPFSQWASTLREAKVRGGLVQMQPQGQDWCLISGCAAGFCFVYGFILFQQQRDGGDY